MYINVLLAEICCYVDGMRKNKLFSCEIECIWRAVARLATNTKQKSKNVERSKVCHRHSLPFCRENYGRGVNRCSLWAWSYYGCTLASNDVRNTWHAVGGGRSRTCRLNPSQNTIGVTGNSAVSERDSLLRTEYELAGR